MTSKLDDGFAALAALLRASSVRVHDERGRGSGSGVVWDARGVVITNAHVARGRSATIETADGTRVRAEVTRRDDARDLAALGIPARVTPLPAAVRDSASVSVGELVVAVGNPLGLVGALTAGLVQRSNARFVVADVKLEPGNSGGALADARGRVVGINSMVAGGLALAIPSAAVLAFLGSATAPGRLGVGFLPALVRSEGSRVPALLITSVEDGSRAQRAGLTLGDAILVPLDVKDVTSALSTGEAIDIVRGGKRMTLALPRADGDARAA